MIALAVFIGLGTALVQGGPLAALGDGGAAVALPAAIAAGWAAVRGPREAVILVFTAAVILGVLSEVRVGLFALALLPSAVAGTLAGLGTPGYRTRVVRASASGLAGAVGYVALMAAVAGGLSGGPPIVWGFAMGTLIAAVTCAALFPSRPHDRRLFA